MKKIVFIISLFIYSSILSQATPPKTSSQIYQDIKKLNFLGSLLYVAAHPDDENTAMISAYSNQVHARVGYLSLTRGDGGQNLIGSEIRELLGVIRTEELLSARRIDGGHQFFTRANDFGYSKHPDETLHFWKREEVLADMVYVIRKFKPDVIINRFDHRTPGTTHGHHTASAMLSVEAFGISGDQSRFTSQLKSVEPWQPKRQFYNTSWWFYGSQKKFKKVMEQSDFLQVNVGTYYPNLGISNTEIAAVSRSQHKSQGFGVAGKRGDQIEYLEPINGDWDTKDSSVFAGINTTWSRVEGGAEIGLLLKRVQANFDFNQPSKSVPELLRAYTLISELKDAHWREIKLEEIKEIIADCLGLYLRVSVGDEMLTVGQNVSLNFEAINRSDIYVRLNQVEIVLKDNQNLNVHHRIDTLLRNNHDVQFQKGFTIPKSLKYSTPYWLESSHSLGMYEVADQQLIGMPETPKQLKAVFDVKIENQIIQFEKDWVYTVSDPALGEVVRPVSIVPDVSLSIPNKTLIFPDVLSKEIKVNVKAFRDDISGVVRLNHPKDWTVYPQGIKIDIDKKGMQKSVSFNVTPPTHNSEVEIGVEFLKDNETYTQEIHLINYTHIDEKTVLLPAQVKAIHLDIQTKGKNIGYVIGAGDEVPQSLREIGYQVTEFLPKDITMEKLSQFNAVVVGIRAYDIDNDLPLYQDILFEYVKKGGTVINQYNSTRELTTKRVAPYPLDLSHNRVTEEDSPVRFLLPNHPVLNIPNKITQNDFKGWVQERGLYFPEKWAKEFIPILGMHDQGEEELKGSLLVAKYGEGHFVYTGLSFFRELPAGVSGAYRLFANLLSLGN